MPLPRNQAGRSRSEGLSKATLSHLLPTWCLEHTLLFVLFNASSMSGQPEVPLAAKCSCPLVCLGGIRTLMLSTLPLHPPSQPFMVQGSWGRCVSCLLMEECLGLQWAAWGLCHCKELIRSPAQVSSAQWPPMLIISCVCSFICKCLAYPGPVSTPFLSVEMGYVISVVFGVEEGRKHPFALDGVVPCLVGSQPLQAWICGWFTADPCSQLLSGFVLVSFC